MRLVNLIRHIFNRVLDGLEGHAPVEDWVIDHPETPSRNRGRTGEVIRSRTNVSLLHRVCTAKKEATP